VRSLIAAVAVAGVGAGLTSVARGARAPVVNAENESGVARTINVNGPVVDDDNPFFADLGVNGRRCVTCHQPEQNMSITPAGVRARLEATEGTDPLFRTNDGADSPLADVSTPAARRAAYGMLLSKGVIRVGLAIPSTAEFELVDVKDPHGYAGHNASGNELSLFRRPLPATNLRFVSAVMWDGRETARRGTAAAIHFNLAQQANNATTGHAQAPVPLDAATRDDIVRYQMGNFTAQVFDRAAGDLHGAGAHGGPEPLVEEASSSGRTIHSAATPAASTAPDRTSTSAGSSSTSSTPGPRSRAAAATPPAVPSPAGLFNTLEMPITGVAGINDDFQRAERDGHVRYLSRHAACGRPLGAGAAEHRRRGSAHGRRHPHKGRPRRGGLAPSTPCGTRRRARPSW
jgi:cytochrome c peroxidase